MGPKRDYIRTMTEQDPPKTPRRRLVKLYVDQSFYEALVEAARQDQGRPGPWVVMLASMAMRKRGLWPRPASGE